MKYIIVFTFIKCGTLIHPLTTVNDKFVLVNALKFKVLVKYFVWLLSHLRNVMHRDEITLTLHHLDWLPVGKCARYEDVLSSAWKRVIFSLNFKVGQVYPSNVPSHLKTVGSTWSLKALIPWLELLTWFYHIYGNGFWNGMEREAWQRCAFRRWEGLSRLCGSFHLYRLLPVLPYLKVFNGVFVAVIWRVLITEHRPPFGSCTNTTANCITVAWKFKCSIVAAWWFSTIQTAVVHVNQVGSITARFGVWVGIAHDDAGWPRGCVGTVAAATAAFAVVASLCRSLKAFEGERD